MSRSSNILVLLDSEHRPQILQQLRSYELVILSTTHMATDSNTDHRE